MFFIGLLVTINFINFSNTEAFLNGLTHTTDHHRDYDHDGEKDSAHTHHISAFNIIKLSSPKIEAALIVQTEPVILEKFDFNYQPTFMTSKYNPSIFRPPIFV